MAKTTKYEVNFMVNRKKKAVVLGLCVSIMTTCLPWTARAQTESYLNDCFESTVEDWEIGYAKSSEGDYAGIEMTQEDGMLKFTAPIAKDVYGAYRKPNVIRKINNGVGIAIPQNGDRLVIKSRVIIPTGGRLACKINLPDTPASWNAARGAHILWNVGGDGFHRMNGCTQSTTSPTNHTWRLNEHLENAVLENKPMDVTVEMYKQSGTFRADYSVVVAGNTYTYTGADLTQFTQAEEDYSTLKNIACVAEQTTDAMDYYIDNVQIYYKNGVSVTSRFLNDLSKGYICDTDEFKIEFGADMSEDTLNADSIVMTNEKAETIEYNAENAYDSDKRIYTISPIEPLVDGEYTISFDFDKIKYSIDLDAPIQNDMLRKITFNYYENLPPKAPIAEEVGIGGTIAVKRIVTGTYKFTDENGDSECESKYQWYVSDSLDGEYLPIDNANKIDFTIPENFEGKYIKFEVTPMSENEPYYGDAVRSEAVQVLSGMALYPNLLKNPDFETGDMTGWQYDSQQMNADVINDGTAQSGKYYMAVTNRLINAYYYNQRITIKENETYLFNGYARIHKNAAVEEFGLFPYLESKPGNAWSDLTINDSVNMKKGEDWKQISKVLTCVPVEGAETITTGVSLLTWPAGKPGYDFCVDNLYFGELEIGDIEVNVPESIQIPEIGEVSYSISGKPLNQLGFDKGLTEQKVTWKLPEETRGVYIKDNKIFVTKDAIAGDVILEAICTPNGLPGVMDFSKEVAIPLLTNDNKTPMIENVSLTGTVITGKELKVDYNYYQIDSEEDASQIEWYYSDIDGNNFSIIPNTAGKSYVVEAAYANGKIKVKVQAKTESGILGSVYESNLVYVPSAPEVSNIKISDGRFVDEKIVGAYEYFDRNGDKQAGEKFRWLRSDSENGTYTAIPGATEAEYVLTDDDVEKYLKLEVVAVSENEPTESVPTISAAVKGPSYPYATNVRINQSSNLLTGEYKYNSDNGAVEGDTVCKWYRNGVLVGTGMSYKTTENGTYIFEVTPVAQKKPYEGKPVSASKNVTVKSSGGGGGASSSSGGSLGYTPNGGIFNVISEIVKPANEEKTKFSDISNHWAKEYIEKAVELGIIESDESLFRPDDMALRSDCISWIADACSVEAVEYRNEFEDVKSEDEFSGKLQALVDIGVISKDVNFRPQRNITREQMCKVIAKVLEYKMKELPQEVNLKGMFSDYNDISEWAIPYVEVAVSFGMMNGVGDDLFAPKGNISRAQIATLICRLTEKIGGAK